MGAASWVIGRRMKIAAAQAAEAPAAEPTQEEPNGEADSK